jgi:hypothetical protein
MNLADILVATFCYRYLNHEPGGGKKLIMLVDTIARGWENLVSRLGGPMSFRFLIQPAVAIFFAVRAGVRDARENKPTFLGCALSNPRSWSPRMRQSWKDVGAVFIVALVLDAIYQIAVQGGIFTLELLITATVLALVPYMVLRDLVSRVARRLGVGKHADRSTKNDEEIPI